MNPSAERRRDLRLLVAALAVAVLVWGLGVMFFPLYGDIVFHWVIATWLFLGPSIGVLSWRLLKRPGSGSVPP